MIVKTEAVALRLDPFSKTSQIVTWMTPHHGRVVTLAKGAQRKRSDFIGSYDLFYTCEILYYSSTRRTLTVLKECSPIRTRCRWRTDWRACWVVSYVSDIVNRTAMVGQPHQALFDFIVRILDFIDENGASRQILHWTELKLFGLMGVAPRLDACIVCGAACAEPNRAISFSVAMGGLVCRLCQGRTRPTSQDIPPDVVSMLRAWQRTPSPQGANRTFCTAAQIDAADSLLRAFLAHHLEALSRSRDIALRHQISGR
jgi:DNA repair protein RecO (recombination protein O)